MQLVAIVTQDKKKQSDPGQSFKLSASRVMLCFTPSILFLLVILFLSPRQPGRYMSNDPFVAKRILYLNVGKVPALLVMKMPFL